MEYLWLACLRRGGRRERKSFCVIGARGQALAIVDRLEAEGSEWASTSSQ